MASKDGSAADDDGNAIRNGAGTVLLRNPNIKLLEQDILYHLGLGTKSHDLGKMFGDVKFVCMGGTQNRMEIFARHVLSVLADDLPAGTEVQDVLEYSHRYSMYKVGPVLCVNHGIGIPSLQILLHEIIKLLYYAEAKEPVFFRIGTSGGIGIEPGSVVISTGGVDETIQPYHEQTVLGERIRRPAKFDQALARELESLGEPEDGFQLVLGSTMASMDFYEGQGRLDGAFCRHTEAQKMAYLRKLYDAGVRNIEMEATCFGAFTHLAGIRAAIVCVTFLDRLKGDQVCPPKAELIKWESRPQQIVGRYIKRHFPKK